MTSPNGKRPRHKRKRKKTAAKTAGPALVPQPHGGALLTGGVPGNAGGVGRLPKEVRARARGSFYERIPVLEEIADNADASHGDRISAVDKLGKYGLAGDPELVVTSETARAFFDCVDKAIKERLGEDLAESISERARELFKNAVRKAS